MLVRELMKAIRRHWWGAFRHGVSGSTFGSGIAIAAFIVAYAQQRDLFAALFPARLLASFWFTPLAYVVTSLLLVTLFHALVVAPYRAWRMLDPFRVVKVASDQQDEHPKGAFPAQSAFVEIENRSYQQRSNCRLHVLQIAGFENQHHALPRLVSEFSLASGKTQRINFLTWTTRSPPAWKRCELHVVRTAGMGLGRQCRPAASRRTRHRHQYQRA